VLHTNDPKRAIPDELLQLQPIKPYFLQSTYIKSSSYLISFDDMLLGQFKLILHLLKLLLIFIFDILALLVLSLLRSHEN